MRCTRRVQMMALAFCLVEKSAAVMRRGRPVCCPAAFLSFKADWSKAIIVMEISVTVRDPDPQFMPPVMIETYDAWKAQCENRPAPIFKHFRLDQLPVKAISWCAVMNVQRNPVDFIYRFFGTGRGRLQGKEYTGFSVLMTSPQIFGQKGFDELIQVLNENKPLHFETHFKLESEGKYDCLRMPLVDHEETITQILSYTEGGANFSQMYRAYGTEMPNYEYHRE